MTTHGIKGLLFDYDGVISSLMARVGWSYLYALKKAKPDIKREVVNEALYSTAQKLLTTTERLSPLYIPQIIAKVSNISGLNFFQKVKFVITGVIMYNKCKMIVVPQPGAIDTLSLLAKDYKMGLVTSAKRELINKASEQIPILKEFDVLITREDCVYSKPHPEGILKGIKGLGLFASDCLYVGDMPSDVIASRKANVKVIGILGEFKEIAQKSFESLKPDYIIPYLKDLPNLLRKIKGKEEM
ncbi:MAG: HAD-IA family hydrolase [Candidatus Heimdallarchaeota archaeon]|nr:HAD-IA family hydrolase [Candidatus Heimdallarchaeota archaeon]MBY8993266.1 HAD-IA family hydrolase [Candidatus Heimdallarchaeota archaeon]